MKYAKKLRKGDKVAIVSLSSGMLVHRSIINWTF